MTKKPIPLADKIAALDYILFRLAKFQMQEEKWSLKVFNEKNNYNLEFVNLIPYVILTANGVPNRKKMLEYAFDYFKIEKTILNENYYAYYEIDIKKNLNETISKNVKYSENKIEFLKDVEELENIQCNCRDVVDHIFDNVIIKRGYKIFELIVNDKDLIYYINKSPIIKYVFKQYGQKEYIDDNVISEYEFSIFAEKFENAILV